MSHLTIHRLLHPVQALAWGILAVVILFGMGGCTRTVAVMAPRAAIPIDMLTCPNAPDLRRTRTDADVAHGIAAMAESDRACRAHLAATRDALSGH